MAKFDIVADIILGVRVKALNVSFRLWTQPFSEDRTENGPILAPGSADDPSGNS